MRLLIYMVFFLGLAEVSAQIIPDNEFAWFYRYADDCKEPIGCSEYYLSAHQDPRILTYSKAEFIAALNGIFQITSGDKSASRILKLRLAYPLDHAPFILDAGVKNGEFDTEEVASLKSFVQSWIVDPARHNKKKVASINRLYIYWEGGIVNNAIWRKGLFKEDK